MNKKTWGMKVVDTALSYANYRWIGLKTNILHGLDSNGTMVDTPDTSWSGEELSCGWWQFGKVNVGIPYNWGGICSIEEFGDGIKFGKYAGNVPEDKSRRTSLECVGVDCSGLLSVCWELDKKIATRDIPIVANVIDNLNEIQQGDVFALVGSHVMFFIKFKDINKDIAVIVDSTRSIGKVSIREVSVKKLFELGYKIYRKK